jgi:hypothetical protein
MKPTHSTRTKLAGCGSTLALMLMVASIGAPSAVAQSNFGKPSMEARSAFATRIESELRAQGSDQRLQLAGDQRDVLEVKSPTMSPREVYAFVNSQVTKTGIKGLGFRMLAFSNGQRRWVYNLERESMVLTPEETQ